MNSKTPQASELCLMEYGLLNKWLNILTLDMKQRKFNLSGIFLRSILTSPFMIHFMD